MLQLVTTQHSQFPILESPNGSFVVNGDDYIFTPELNFNGNLDFSYVLSDGTGGTLDVFNSFSITPLNDAPVRIAGNVSTLFLIEDAPMSSMGLEDLDYTVGGGPDESAPRL